MLIKRLSYEEQGRHYGYPTCCIENYSNQSDQTNINARREKYQFIYGYLPCAQCYEKLTNGADINSLLVNRKCVGPISSDRACGLNYSDPVSQFQIFLTELDLLIKKTARLTKLPYDNVGTWEQIQFLINPKRMNKKRVSVDRMMTYHNIGNIARILKIQPEKSINHNKRKSLKEKLLINEK